MHHHRQAEQWAWHKSCRLGDNTPDRGVLDADGAQTGHQRTEPVGEIDNIWTRDAGKEILGSPGESRDLVGKDRATDQQEVIVED